jgi:pimeloyl-ACP methyl ester carboxylesterase
VVSLTGDGYAVAFTDYQGLGTDGAHPYLEPRTAAFNVIDSVRALRQAFPEVSTKWLAVGGSQGGQAAWGANEYAKDYGAGLDFVGSLAVAPAVDLTSIADQARTGDLSPIAVSVMPLIIAGLEVAHPSLQEADYLRGAASEHKQALISCSKERDEFAAELSADDVRPSSAAAADALLKMLEDNALPQRALTAPMLVVNGSDDDMVRPEWVDGAVRRACDLGGTVDHIVQQGRGHLDVTYGDQGTQWIRDRFDDKPPSSNCDASS